MKTKLGDVGIIGLQMLKLVSLYLVTQVDRTLYRECCSQPDGLHVELLIKKKYVNQISRYWISVTKYKVLPTFVFICELFA
jgi:hypothetical protein